MFINKNTSIVCSTYCEGYNNTQYYYYEIIILYMLSYSLSQIYFNNK